MAPRRTKSHRRHDGRRPGEVRPVTIQRHFVGWADGSVFIACGRTRLICTASVIDGVPPFLRETSQGWLTAEYDMLPASTRMRRPRSSRTGRVERSRMASATARAAVGSRKRAVMS